MELNEYQRLAQRTSNAVTRFAKIENGLLGLFGEGDECADIFKKFFMFQGHGLEREQMVRELGDVLWYVAEVAAGLEVSLEYVAQHNIDKLKARYPEGFDPEKSMHRQEGDT